MPRSLDELIDFRDLLAEQLQIPEFRAEWERLAAARAVSEIVLGARINQGLTQSALARLAGVSQPAIARLETGEHSPTIETLIKIANALDIEITVVITPATRASDSGNELSRADKQTAEVTATQGAHLLVAAG